MSSNDTTSSDMDSLVEKVTTDLANDFDRFWDKHIEDPADLFWRRALVRAAFAYFEGLISTMKRKALLVHKLSQLKKFQEKPEPKGTGLGSIVHTIVNHYEKARQGANFSSSEILLMLDQSVSLDDNGEIKLRKAKLRLETNLQFAFRMYAKAFQVEYSLPKDAGWQAFKAATRIRDRLTHPKIPVDIDVSDNDLSTVFNAVLWLKQSEYALVKLAHEKAHLEDQTKGGEAENLSLGNNLPVHRIT
jgi:hypothetical protein